MEKGKGIDIQLTEKELRMELQRLRHEIQETKEKRMEVEFATAVARAANAALDAELAAKMTKYDKPIAVPKDTNPGATEEVADEEIIYTPPFLVRLNGGDKKITLPAYERTHSVGARVMPCALIYEYLKASGTLKPLEGTTFGFGHESSQKTCAYHPNQRGHTIEECVELKAAIRNLINIGEIPVYVGLIQKGVLASIRKNDEAIDPIGLEIWKPCPYHDAINHNIGRSKGPTDSFPSQSSQKGKAAMGDNNEETSLIDIMVAQPALADQNELILQLMQQIAEIRVEM
uniref:Uncharacterized protein n=1 Tax=Solanum tuberosum TaxID=4113 RepID=M1DD01_SOLTU